MSGCDMDEKLYAYERLYTIPYQEMYIPDMMRIVLNKSNIIFIRNDNCKILSIN